MRTAISGFCVCHSVKCIGICQEAAWNSYSGNPNRLSEWPLISKFNKTPSDNYRHRKWHPNYILRAFVSESLRNLQFRHDF